MGQNANITFVGKTSAGVFGPVAIDANGHILTTGPSAAAGGTQVASSAVVTNAVATATLAATAGKTWYVTGFLILAGGATVGSTVTATITGLNGGTLNIPVTVAAGATVPLSPIAVDFANPVSASAVNTAVVISLPALGAGNAGASVAVFGFLV